MIFARSSCASTVKLHERCLFVKTQKVKYVMMISWRAHISESNKKYQIINLLLQGVSIQYLTPLLKLNILRTVVIFHWNAYATWILRTIADGTKSFWQRKSVGLETDWFQESIRRCCFSSSNRRRAARWESPWWMDGRRVNFTYETVNHRTFNVGAVNTKQKRNIQLFCDLCQSILSYFRLQTDEKFIVSAVQIRMKNRQCFIDFWPPLETSLSVATNGLKGNRMWQNYPLCSLLTELRNQSFVESWTKK